ncbi:MAG: sugar ABC transporter ATP-binding protein, partial [Synergistaceae bacterium]|nr:sugar ABC transporter ATP-binding protein [Synergistaceae bacterium]
MPILETFGLSKRFPGVLALDDFSFQLSQGEVHGLVGENGAGKSTLVKILSGVYRPTSGSFSVNGERADFRSPRDAAGLVGVVHQDRELVPFFNGCENLFLGMEESRLGFLNKKKMMAETRAFMERYKVDFDPASPAASLSGGRQQMLSILKVLFRDPKVVILDEPTAPLSVRECDALFSLVGDLKAKGVAVLYISHHLSEVLNIADRVTVMRNGRKVATERASELTEAALIRLMLSRDMTEQYPKRPSAIGDVVFRAEDGDAEVTIRAGEIVGFAGLVGAGRTELGSAVFTGAGSGTWRFFLGDEGSLTPFSSRGPRHSIDQGVVMISENRREEGLVVDMSVLDNLTLPLLKNWTALGFVSRAGTARAAGEVVSRYGIRCWGLPQAVRTLSGGNQQKVSIGKWSGAGAKLWIFDEPTQGVDVDAKREIYEIMGDLAEGGAGVWFISSELRELLALSDRIYVMRGQ